MGPMLLSFGLKLKKKEANKPKDVGITVKEMMAYTDDIQKSYGDYPDVKDRIFGAMQRLPLPEWKIEN